jgi:hypothetical protein
MIENAGADALASFHPLAALRPQRLLCYNLTAINVMI